MRVVWSSELGAVSAHRDQLREIAALSRSAPFADIEVLDAWHASLPTDREFRVGIVLDDTTALGLLAMWGYRASANPRTAWHLWGETVDFGVVWARPGIEGQCWQLWLDDLRNDGIEQLRLRNLRVGDPVVSALIEVAGQLAMPLELLDRRFAPYIDLTTGHDGWLRSRSKSQRRQYRRAEEALHSIPGISIDVVERADEVGVALEDFFVLHRQRRSALERGSVYDDEGTERFLRKLVEAWAPTGRLRALVAQTATKTLGVELIVTTANTWYSFNGGWDVEYARHHVGTGLLIQAMHAARAAGVKRYSLLEGEEPYKLRMATGRHQLATWDVLVAGESRALS